MKKRAGSKRPRRDKVKYPSLDKKYMPRLRQESMDYDYLDKLNPDELAWLDRFTNEYLNASFKHDETDIQSYEIYGKDSNDRNNARNRDLYGLLKLRTHGKTVNYDSVVGEVESALGLGADPLNIESAYLEYIDFKEVEVFLAEYNEAMNNFIEIEDTCLLEYINENL
jgi:hypothetical protein